MANINYPFGSPVIFTVPTGIGTYEYTIANDYTIIDAKSLLSANTRRLKLKFDQWLKVGARMIIMQKASGGKGITLGTGFSGLAQVSAASKKLTTCDFIYDGTAFIPTGGVFTQG